LFEVQYDTLRYADSAVHRGRYEITFDISGWTYDFGLIREKVRE